MTAANPERHTGMPTLFAASYPDRLVDCDDEARCTQYDEQWQDLRRRRGPSQAVDEWFPPVLDDWLRLLDDEGLDVFDCGGELPCRVAVTMTGSLAMRDAMIVGAIIDRSRWDRATLMGFASRPHDESSGRAMGRMLTEAFESAGGLADPARMERAMALCERVGEVVPRRYAAQPFAVASYVAWWSGCARALSLAVLALDLDMHVSLAGIVQAAILRRIHPAWVRGAARLPE